MLWPLVAAAGSNDSIWVKVPLAAVDSVWVKVPAAVPDVKAATRPSEYVAEKASADTAYVPVVPGTANARIAGHSVWSRKHQYDPGRVYFAWGAEVGSSIDMGGYDMSSVDFNATFGLRYRWINFAGIGAGANIMVSNSCRTYPVFAVFRTDFSGKVKFMFLDIRGGAALNYLPANIHQTDVYGSVSLGFVLATGKSFRSYLMAGYTYVGRRDVAQGEMMTEFSPLSMASIRLGISF